MHKCVNTQCTHMFPLSCFGYWCCSGLDCGWIISSSWVWIPIRPKKDDMSMNLRKCTIRTDMPAPLPREGLLSVLGSLAGEVVGGWGYGWMVSRVCVWILLLQAQRGKGNGLGKDRYLGSLMMRKCATRTLCTLCTLCVVVDTPSPSRKCWRVANASRTTAGMLLSWGLWRGDASVFVDKCMTPAKIEGVSYWIFMSSRVDRSLSMVFCVV